MKKNTDYNFKQIENFAEENNYDLQEEGPGTIGKTFIVLEHNEKNIIISFILTGYNSAHGNQYTCIYSDIKEEAPEHAGLKAFKMVTALPTKRP